MNYKKETCCVTFNSVCLIHCLTVVSYIQVRFNEGPISFSSFITPSSIRWILVCLSFLSIGVHVKATFGIISLPMIGHPQSCGHIISFISLMLHCISKRMNCLIFFPL